MDCITVHGERDSSVGIATELRAVRFGDRMPVRGEIFRTRPDRPWGPPSLLHNRHQVFPRRKTAGGGGSVDHPLHLVPRLKKE